MSLMQKIEPKEPSSPTYININSGLNLKKRFINLTVSAKGMRIIDKKGIDQVLSEIRSRGEKI